ncbi:helix-turn-helix domain-containing protein [Parapedobacter sp. 2B3]|uniref:helix-turn-helix domain-containing protein n=1 Tax=Parapedobacter sp. 2B3 TaxID=3342381 RepID=UPI0035B629BA
MAVEKIVFKEMSHLDYLFTLHIKKLREAKGWSQQDLSKKMGVTLSFVGNVESFIQRHKYGIRHLTLLAKVFKFKSMSKLFDFPTPEHDMIRLTLKVAPKKKKDGTPSKGKDVEVIKIEPIEKSGVE